MLTSIVEVWRLDKGDKFYHGGHKTPYEVVENLGDGFIKYSWRGTFGRLSDGWKVNAIVDDLSKVNKWALKQKPLKKTQDIQKALNEFQEQSRQTAANLSPLDAISIYGLGTWTEGGEGGDLIKKFISPGHPLDLNDLRKEVGDCLWYASRVCDFLQVRLGIVWSDAKTIEIDKVKMHSESQFSITDHAVLDCLAIVARGSSSILFHAREINKITSYKKNDDGSFALSISSHKGKINNGLKWLVTGLKSLLSVYCIDILEVIEINQQKLKARYHGGFSTEASMERVDTKKQKKAIHCQWCNNKMAKWESNEIKSGNETVEINFNVCNSCYDDCIEYVSKLTKKDDATCPDCHRQITSGEEFVFKKCFECASGTNKEAATDRGYKMNNNPLWKVHTPNLLGELLEHGVMLRPLQIFARLLDMVATRASQLNDPELNSLMCRLTLYEVADPGVEGYNKDLVDKIINYKELKHYE